MSRAFVSDSDGQFQEEDVPEIRNPLPPGAKNYMTPEGAKRLKKELQDLSESQRPSLVAEISRIGAGSSNPERNAALAQRRRVRELDRRVEYLSELVRGLEVIDPRKQPPGRVAFGVRVTVEQDGERKEYQIVGVEESDPAAGRVSWISPIAKALMTKRVGERVALKLPSGESTLTILNVDYP